MIFGILEANDRSIWFGTSNGVYRYDGNTFNTLREVLLRSDEDSDEPLLSIFESDTI
jgi:ligand-binding sensor domain-containing protein